VQAQEAKGFFPRLKGLMFKKSISNNEALIFYKTPSIHTFFMKFPIDVIFLNHQKKVIRIVKNVIPNRIVYCKGAWYTIECKGENISVNYVNLGDTLSFQYE